MRADQFDPDAYRNWPAAAQQKALELLDDVSGAPEIWYCKRGRICDGMPHQGVPYNHARGDQWPPSDRIPFVPWRYWVLLSGRGSGKTRSGAEWIRKMSDKAPRLAMIAPTTSDIRDTLVEGLSGLLFVCRRAGIAVDWEPSKRRITFPNGAVLLGYSAEEPDRLRGANTSVAWLDEPAFYPNIDYVWKMLQFGLRVKSDSPTRVALTTTPTPHPWVKAMVVDPKARVTTVSTYANAANLDEDFLQEMRDKYEGTRIGRQELHAEILGDVEGALWHHDMIEGHRIPEKLDDGTPIDPVEFAKTLERVIVAVDPAGTSLKRSDETGIVVMGVLANQIYILRDVSGQYTPNAWANRVLDVYEMFGADAVVAENNYGGEMVKATLHHADLNLPVKEVNSRRGKFIRAEPVNALYEQGRAHHFGVLTKLEDQLCSWIPGQGTSPDRLDAMVHGAHELVKLSRPASISTPTGTSIASVTPAGLHLIPGRVYGRNYR